MTMTDQGQPSTICTNMGDSSFSRSRLASTNTSTSTSNSTSTSVAMDESVNKAHESQKRKRYSSHSSSSDLDNSSTASDSDSNQTTTQTKKRKKKKSTRTDHRREFNSNDQQPTIDTSSSGAYPCNWSQLNIDFIESITSFLPALEISYLHRTCHAWVHIANHIRAPHLFFPSADTPWATVKKLVVSRLILSLIRRHVKTLVMMNYSVTPTELELIAYHLPKLQQLICSIAYVENSSWIFPLHLKKICVFFEIKSNDLVSLEAISNSLNQCIQGVSRSTTSLNVLRLSTIFNEVLTDDQFHLLSSLPINLHPLTRLIDSLTRLELGPVSLTTDHIQVLRQLVNLTYLDIGDQVTHTLAELLADPIPFRLMAFITDGHYYSNEDVPIMKRLTHLTNFDGWEIADLTDFSFLPHMVQLRQITVQVLHPGDTDEINDQDLTLIFSRTMPQLKIFRLGWAPNITSLAFMVQLSATLEEFYLVHCTAIEPIELVHLRFFPRLRLLDLTQSFPPDHRLDSFTLGLINPNSPVFQREWFPALTELNLHSSVYV